MMPTLVAPLALSVLLTAPAAADEPDPAGPQVQRMAAFDHEPFGRIVAAVVVGERVDYAAVARSHRPALRAYLDRIAAFDPKVLPDADRLTLYLNLYNATMIDVVVSKLARDPKWTPAADEWGVFGEDVVRVGGRTFSLNHLENEVIRKEFDEPRIHVALVCAAVSCPPLIDAAYAPATLTTTLEENMRRFLNDPDRNRVDHRAKSLKLSQIFEWYADDFGGREKLARYADRYLDGDVSGYEVEFLPYDWALNGAE